MEKLNKILTTPRLARQLIKKSFTDYNKMLTSIDFSSASFYYFTDIDTKNPIDIIFCCLVSKSSKLPELLHGLIPNIDIVRVCQKLYGINKRNGLIAFDYCYRHFTYDQIKSLLSGYWSVRFRFKTIHEKEGLGSPKIYHDYGS